MSARGFRVSALRVGVLAAALAVTAPAAAQDNLERARMLFNAGAEAYGTGQYPVAIQAFQEAHRLSERPGLLFSIAQAYRQQYYVDKNPANVRGAIQYYRDYLSKVKSGARVGEAAKALSELEPIAARLTADTGETPAPTPPPATRATPHQRDLAHSGRGAQRRRQGRRQAAVLR